MLDTGADYTILPESFATEFGFTFGPMQKVSVEQAAGVATFYRPEEGISAILPGLDYTFELEPLYSDRALDVVWGRIDFLRYWDLFLSQRGKFFTLSWAL